MTVLEQPTLARLQDLLDPEVWSAVAADLAPFTPEQLAVVEALLETPEHLVVSSTAGSGKSTVLRVLAQLLPPGRNAVLAFGVSIAQEIAPRMPVGVTVTPLHKLGHKLLRAGRKGGVTVVPFKRRNLVRAQLAALGLPPGLTSDLTRLAERALTQLTPATEGALRALAAELDLLIPQDVPILDVVRSVSDESVRQYHETGVVDYTDLLYLPIKLGLGQGMLDHALVDEAQDLSRLQLRFVRHLAGAHGRLVLVGDADQTLYGFSGADVGGLARAVAELPARLLHLTVTFRCPTSHVRLAQRYSTHIQAAPGAQEGEVRTVDLEAAILACQPGDLVMARLNAPIVGFALRLAERGLPVTVLGHDLERVIGDAAQEALPGTFAADEVEGRVLAYATSRLDALITKGLRGQVLARAVRAEEDRLACVAALAVQVASAGPASARDVAALVKRLTEPQDGAVRLCTVHRAKGLEATRALLLEPDELLAVPDDAERPVAFVAVTRATNALWFVQSAEA